MPTHWTAFIPLRDGSKGLPGKNTRPLAEKPLYQHAVDQAINAGANRILISTDIPQVLSADHLDQTTLLSRPAELASDQTPMDAVLVHALNSDPVTGPIVLLQATSPLRQTSDIQAALALFDTGKFDLVKTVTQTDAGILKYGFADQGRFVPVSDPKYCFTNRQTLPAIFRPNGAVYVFDADWFRQNGTLATDKIGMVDMPADRSQDIDTLADFTAIEAQLKS